MKNIGKTILVLLGLTAVFFSLFWWLSRDSAQKVEQEKVQKEQLAVLALGDSLTEGVGDQTKAGGYVPMLKKDLVDTYDLTSVTVENFGHAGDRSDQITKRLNRQAAIQKGLKQADIITLTVGGNDLMQVLQEQLLAISVKNVKKAEVSYQKNLTALFTLIRQYNQKAPIFVLGIYNPFNTYFPNIKEMNTIVTNWNQATQMTVKKMTDMYFVDIQHLFDAETSKAVQATAETTSSTVEGATNDSSLATAENPFISTDDNFHPNNRGYQKMTTRLFTVIQKQQKEWLKK